MLPAVKPCCATGFAHDALAQPAAALSSALPTLHGRSSSACFRLLWLAVYHQIAGSHVHLCFAGWQLRSVDCQRENAAALQVRRGGSTTQAGAGRGPCSLPSATGTACQRCAGASPPPQQPCCRPLCRCLQPHRAPPVLVPAGLRHWRGGGEMVAEHRGRGHDVGLPKCGESDGHKAPQSQLNPVCLSACVGSSEWRRHRAACRLAALAQNCRWATQSACKRRPVQPRTADRHCIMACRLWLACLRLACRLWRPR